MTVPCSYLIGEFIRCGLPSVVFRRSKIGKKFISTGMSVKARCDSHRGDVGPGLEEIDEETFVAHELLESVHES